ncbi:MAG: WbqC family protein [bacterium]|nr:WbqC family protein [bacterium]
MKISVLIPGYFPVLEYFALIAAADRVVLLDDIKLPRKSSAYRMQISSGVKPEWLSVSLMRGNRSGELIRDKKIDYETNWKKLHLKRVYHTYKQCIYFDEIYPQFEDILGRDWKYLFDMDRAIIELISSGIQIPHEIISSSELKVPEKEPERYIEFIKAAGGETLLAGMELRKFLNEDLIVRNGIKLEWLEYDHPGYRQENTSGFIPDLTILDALFNCGKYNVHFFY